MEEVEQRQDPNVLLERLAKADSKRQKGKLKVYFGYAPGVGKTYSMLQVARRLAEQGQEVVVGYVEPHGRPDTTSLLQGLECLSPSPVHYRGKTLLEFDLARAIRRNPKILLVDELAHTNASGSKHKKRWQDVLELLECGIDVHTTLNVQHLESLNDVILQITGVRVRETVPDQVLHAADEIELVDLSPEELLGRLKEGKVYLPEQAERAAGNFFRRGNLLALRELALRRTAERIDADVQAYRDEHGIGRTWAAAERILVCVGPSPSSAMLIRAAVRMAAGLRARWVAAYVESPNSQPMQREDRHRLQAHLRLVESLGGEVVKLEGEKVSDELITYARKHNVTRVIIGKPTHARWRDLIWGSTVNELLRASGDIDVHFIGEDQTSESVAPPAPLPKRRTFKSGAGIAVALVAAETLLAVALRDYISSVDVVLLYLLGIAIMAFRFGRRSSVVCSAVSVVAFDFFFVPPYHKFVVDDTRYWFTFAVMFGVGLALSDLASRLRRQKRDASRRETRTAALYHSSRDLIGCSDMQEIASVLVHHAREVFEAEAMVVVLDIQGKPQRISVSEALEVRVEGAESHQEGQVFEAATWVMEHGKPAGVGTDTFQDCGHACLPLQSGPTCVGALCLKLESSARLDIENRGFLGAFLRQAAMAMERVLLAEEAKTAVERAKAEEARNTLLSAISHDLRTPLAAITGAGTLIRDAGEHLSEHERKELVESICQDAERMERLIASILDMVRLESGTAVPNMEWMPLEEVIGGAIVRLERRLGDRKTSVMVPEGLPLVRLDPVLMEQVLVNLLENSLKHGESTSPIEVEANAEADRLHVTVSDRGPGFPPGEEAAMFEKFRRGSRAHSGGVGLGLAICRSIVQAHGGTIWAENRVGGGASVHIRLPLGKAPEMPQEPSEEFCQDGRPLLSKEGRNHD